MQPPPVPVSEVELNAYVDGETFPERHAMIEDWLAHTPADATRVETWRRQNQILKAAYARILNEPVPASIPTPISPKVAAQARIAAIVNESLAESPSAPIRHVDRIDRIRREHRNRLVFVTAGSFVAGAAVVCLAALTFGFAPGLGIPPKGPVARIETQIITDLNGAVAKRGLEAYAVFGEDADQPSEFRAGERPKLASWLSNHVGATAAVPDLTDQGMTLAEAHVTPGDFGPAMFLVYQNEAGQRTGVLLGRGPAEETSPSYAESRGVGASVVVRHGIAVATVGRTTRRRLSQLSEVITTKLGPR